MTRKTKQEISYDEIKKELAEIKDMLARREHLDEEVKTMKKDFEGNGKPGFKALRDKLLSWELKVNTITIAVIGDVVFRIILLANSTK